MSTILSRFQAAFVGAAVLSLTSASLAQTTRIAGEIDTTANSPLTTYKATGASVGQNLRPRYSQRATHIGFGSGSASDALSGLDGFTLAPRVREIDLSFPSKGFSVTIGRSFNGAQLNSGTRFVSDGYQGNNWSQDSRPELVQGSNDVMYLVLGADRVMEFRRLSTTSVYYAGVNGSQVVLEWVADITTGNPGTYKLYDLGGRVWTFFDFDAEAVSWGASGQLWRVQDQDGTGDIAYIGTANTLAAAQAAFVSSTPRINRFTDSSGRVFAYSYGTYGGKTRLSSVVVTDGGPEVGRVEYDYYTAASSDGAIGDLKKATITTPLSSGGSLVRTTLYRYDSNSRLRLVIGPEGYRNYSAIADPDTASDAALKPYAAVFYEYSGSTGDVAEMTPNGQCGCAGGGANGEHLITGEINASFGGSLTDSTYTGSGNWTTTDWYRRAVITRPDGAEVHYYDETGQPLGRVVGSTTAFTGTVWASKLERDTQGRIAASYSPAAITGYTHSTGSVSVSASAGLATVQTYFTGDFIAGVEWTRDRPGTGGTAVDRSRVVGYSATGVKSFTDAGSNVAKLSRLLPTEIRTYRSSGTYDATTYSYTFYTSASAWLPKKTTTLPALAGGDISGPTTVTVERHADAKGRTVFTKDGVGNFSYTLYDAYGRATKQVQAAGTGDSDAAGDATTLGVTLGTGLNYTTTYTYDGQSRVTETTLPNGRKQAMHYTKLADERLVTLSVPSLSGTTYSGPVSYSVKNANSSCQGAASGTIALPSGTTTTPIADWINEASSDVKGAVAHGTLTHLSINLYDVTGSRLETSRRYHTIPGSLPGSSGTNYDQSTFAYDTMGRRFKSTDATGTIDTTTYDVMGRPTQRKTGTDDGSPGNMVIVEETVYDGGGSGNSLVTTRTLRPDASATRVTTYAYDWRNRLTLQTNPLPPHTLFAYDDSGRTTSVASYTVAPSASADPTAGTSSNRVSLSETFYNSRGQVKESKTWQIDQSNRNKGSSLSQLAWFDANGRTVKSRGGTLTKSAYDALGRVTHSFVLASDNDTTNADAQNVTGDQVLEEHQSLYSDATGATRGQLQMSVSIQRHPGTTTAGALDAVGDVIDVVAMGNASFRGRASITSYYYDALDRQTSVVSLGTNGGSTYTRSSDTSAGSRSDTRLISSTTYNPEGTVQQTTDPRGLIARTEYDQAGRRTKTINNYVDGTPSGDSDQTILYAYTNGLLTSQTADLPGTDQVTTYTYSSGGLSSDLTSNRLLREVSYPAGQASGSGGSTIVKHGYNRLGQQKSRQDQSGNVIDTTFDALGRETTRTMTTVASGFSTAVRRVEMAYLDRGFPSTVTQFGATTGGTALDQVRYAYDGWGKGTNIYQDVDSDMNASGVSNSGRSAFDFATTWSTSTPSGGVHAHRVTSIASRAGGTAFRTVDYGYDTGSDTDSNRVSKLTMNSGADKLATYSYLGLGAVVTTQLKDAGLITSVETATGVYGDLDNFGRPIKWNWYRDGADATAGFYNMEIAYDRNSNPVSTINNVHAGFTSGLRYQDNLYTLDGLNRVTMADQGNLSGTISNRTRKEAWPVLDLTGNWIERTLDHNGDGSIIGLGDRDEQTNAANSFSGANEWTGSDQKKDTATGYTKFVPAYTYDANGNQISEEVAKVLTAGAGTTYERRFFTYDPFGRMTAVHSDSGKTVLIAEYRYNGLGQRIMWRYDADASGTVGSTERYYYMYDDRWRMVGAFWDSGATPRESFVYHAAGNGGRGSSSYIDSVVMRDRDTDANGTLEERRYYVQNWRADVVAVTKSDGSPLQYVVYSPYGEPVTHAVADVDLDGDVDSNDQAAWANGSPHSTFAYAALEDLNHDGTDSAADDALFDESYADNLGLSGRERLSSGKLDNRKGYAGYEHDESLTMYHVRHRVYRADLGRWMTRDPLGYVDGMGLYEYVGGMAIKGRDPSGLARALPCASGRCGGGGVAAREDMIADAGGIGSPVKIIWSPTCAGLFPVPTRSDPSIVNTLLDIGLYCHGAASCPTVTIECSTACDSHSAGDCSVTVGPLCDDSGTPNGRSPTSYLIHELRHIMQDCQGGDFATKTCNEQLRRELDAYLYARQCAPNVPAPNDTSCCDRACESMAAGTWCFGMSRKARKAGCMAACAGPGIWTPGVPGVPGHPTAPAPPDEPLLPPRTW